MRLLQREWRNTVQETVKGMKRDKAASWTNVQSCVYTAEPGLGFKSFAWSQIYTKSKNCFHTKVLMRKQISFN